MKPDIPDEATDALKGLTWQRGLSALILALSAAFWSVRAVRRRE